MITEKKAAIVACSNGLAPEQKEKIEQLEKTLMGIGMIPILSNYIYEDGYTDRTGQKRAEELMQFYCDKEIKIIFDISGGDLANEVLTYLDYDQIKQSEICFWGYSDLTVLLNAIYAKTGKQSVLYQIRNLIRQDGPEQIRRFEDNTLYDFSYDFIQGDELKGVVTGGNIRCFLKLAGTEFWPDMTGKVLLLEALSGNTPKIITYLNQLKQMGVFKQVAGILLGTFTQMEAEAGKPSVEELVKQAAGSSLPIVKTKEIGHGPDSKAIVIGKEIHLSGGK